MGVAELTRNAVDVLPVGGLERKLALERPLRVKLGIDVTSPDIHVGRAMAERVHDSGLTLREYLWRHYESVP